MFHAGRRNALDRTFNLRSGITDCCTGIDALKREGTKRAEEGS